MYYFIITEDETKEGFKKVNIPVVLLAKKN